MHFTSESNGNANWDYSSLILDDDDYQFLIMA